MGTGMRLAGRVLTTAWLALAAASASFAQRPADPELEARIAAELQALDPQAEVFFTRANKERARDNHKEAARLYGVVRQRVPQFAPAIRRECGERLRLGERTQAIWLCRKAVEAEGSGYDLAALATTLAQPKKGEKAKAAELAEAQQLADRAVAAMPRDVSVRETACAVALARSDAKALDTCAGKLAEIEPDALETHYWATVAAALGERWDDAETSLERARQKGLPEHVYLSLRRGLKESRPRLWPIAKRIGIVWIFTFAALFAAGVALSGAALRASARPVRGASGGETVGMAAWLRRAYAVVLWLCCAFYYVSLPLVILLVLGVGGGIIWAMLAAGRVSVKLVLIVAVVCLITIWAMLKSLFVRGEDGDPGLRLELRKHPRLRQVLGEVAKCLGTRPVDNVYMTPGTDVAVMERGGVVRQMRGHPERCLILGVGALDGLRLRPFKAVLAHEYGHFSNRDTAGGGFALAVRRSLLTMAHHLGEAGAAAWYNPAWWFVNGFFHVFMRISQGASRLQEVLADRWAAFAYGSRALEQGLRHVIEQSVRFDAHVSSTLQEVLTAQAPLTNLYTHQPAQPISAAEVENAVKGALRAKPTAYDSHPAPADRVAWARALGAPGVPAAPDDDEPVWGLFASRSALEEELTAVIRESVRQAHGIPLAG